MRKILVLLVIIVIILVVILMILSMFRKKVSIDDIKSFHFSYSTGTMMYANVAYDLRCDEKCIAVIKPSGVADTEALEVSCDDNVRNEIKKLMEKYHVDKWNGFDKSDNNVLDGNSFSLSIEMQNGETITAYGYMKWPLNYREFSNNVDSIFSKLYNK